MHAHRSILLLLAFAAVAGAQVVEDVGRFEARRRDIRRRYAEAGDHLEKRAIHQEMVALDLATSASPEPDAAGATGVRFEGFDATEREFLERWVLGQVPASLLVPGLAIARSDESERIAYYVPETRTIHLADTFFDLGRARRLLGRRIEEALGEVAAEEFDLPAYWTGPSIFFHELFHAHHLDHRERYDEFLDLAYRDRARRWRESAIDEILAEAAAGYAADPGERAAWRAYGDMAVARDFFRDVGFPMRFPLDFHAADEDGLEYAAIVVELWRYDPAALDDVLTDAERTWLEENLPPDVRSDRPDR